MCAIDDAPPADVWTQTTPTARKKHRCYECRRTIQPGEQYHRVNYLCDGRWGSGHWCRHCDAAGTWLRAVCSGYPLSELYEEMNEHWDEGYKSVGMGRLIIGIKYGWHDGEDPVPDPAEVLALARSMMTKAVA